MTDNSNVKNVQIWLKRMGKSSEIPEQPTIPSEEKMKLSLKLILEELGELAEAYGVEGMTHFIHMLEEKHKELKMKMRGNEKPNLQAIFDAHLDIDVTNGNGVAFSGLTDKYQDGFYEVMKSNSSKVCKDQDQAKRTADYYARKGVDVRIVPNQHGGYVVMNDVGKILKNIDYTPADEGLKKVLNG